MLELPYAECIHVPIAILGLEKEGALGVIERFSTNCVHAMLFLLPHFVPPSYSSELHEDMRRLASARKLRKYRRGTPRFSVRTYREVDRLEHRYVLCPPFPDFADFFFLLRKVVNWWFFAEIGGCGEGECTVRRKDGTRVRVRCPSNREVEVMLRPALVSGSKKERQRLGFRPATSLLPA